MQVTIPDNRAWYALRRTIPPWYADFSIRELADYCRENSIDEVISKVDSEEFTHAIPSPEWVDSYMPVLARIKAALNKIGVRFSINPWVSLVHCDRGRDLRLAYPDIDLMVGHDGIRCRAVACPISLGWRKATKDIWSRYASLEPNVLWVEDDIRLLNHQPVVYGCFCDLHMREFGKRVGREVSREELVEALLAPGEPHPYRKVWLDLNRDAVTETVAFLEKCVHEISPKTKLGLMCSAPTAHAIEGRDWAALTSALAGDQPLVARPCMFNYNEESPRGLYEAEYYFRLTQHCLGTEAIAQTEIENIPYTLYSKSAKFTFLQCALSFVFGADGVTLNLYDHLGTSLSIAPEYGDMLKHKKPYLNALAQRCQGAKASGVGLLHSQDASYHIRLDKGAPYTKLAADGHAWRKVLEPLGFPITFEISSVVALSGQVVRALSKDQIMSILSAGALIDLTALRCLEEMGYGEFLGVSTKREFQKYDEPIAAEEYHNTDFGGSQNAYLTLTLPDLGGDAKMAELELSPGAQMVSRMVDPDTNILYPFLTIYENSLGGRVAVMPIDIEYCAGAAFLNPYRKAQFDAVLAWLSRDRVPMQVSGGAYPLPFRIDHDDYTVVGAFNLTLDDWPYAEIELSSDGRKISSVEILNANGAWQVGISVSVATEIARVRVMLNRPVNMLSLVAMTVWWNDPDRGSGD